METTIKITENQKRAIELVKELANHDKITASEAIILIIGIYENEKEFVYIPYSSPTPSPYQPWTAAPDTTPWWEWQRIYCNTNDTNSVSHHDNIPLTYKTVGL